MSSSQQNAQAWNSPRLPALDGLRGVLALVVLFFHLTLPLGYTLLAKPANIAVVGFFILSGFVLTRRWDGRFGVFLARRFIRLWPVYALCLSIGYYVAQLQPEWSQYLWYPVLSANAKPAIDPPIWSLRIEAWAMLFMPFFVWAGTGRPWRAIVGAAATFAAGCFYVKFNFGLFFILGAFLSRWDFRNRFLESAGPQFLGRISYSLYLTHWLVFAVAQRHFGDVGLIASVPVAFAIGWLCWRFVETPSVQLSRKVGALTKAMKPKVLVVAR